MVVVCARFLAVFCGFSVCGVWFVELWFGVCLWLGCLLLWFCALVALLLCWLIWLVDMFW